jgi:hypothetical protein
MASSREVRELNRRLLEKGISDAVRAVDRRCSNGDLDSESVSLVWRDDRQQDVTVTQILIAIEQSDSSEMLWERFTLAF